MARLLRKKFWLFAAAASAALGANQTAQAQPGASSSDEIVVTATRRESALQDVPIAVTPVTAELVRNSGIRDLQDLTNVAPSLQFNVSENETSATARLRGIGTQGSNPGLESAVGVFIDGVYRARNGVALTDLGEISQIEVLRGPQGTLFGRNTSAGLISVSTAGPDLSGFGASGEATVGNFGERRFAGHITGPIVENELGVRLFVARSVRDGFNDLIDAAGDVSDSNNRDLWTARGQVLWAPSQDFDVRVIADYTDRDETCCAAVFYDPATINGATGELYTASRGALAVNSLGGFGPDGFAALDDPGFGDRNSFGNRDTTQGLQDGGVSIEANWTVGPGVLTSVSSYRDWDFEQGQDIDFTAADLLYRLPGEGGFGFQIFTQELRYGARSGALDWLVGVFYSDESLTRRDTIRIGTQYGEYAAALDTLLGGAIPDPLVGALALSEGGGQRDRYRQEGQSLAVFTHNIFAIDERTDITFGARFTSEEKDMVGERSTIGAFPGAPFPWNNGTLDGITTQSRSEEEWSGVLAGRREFTDNLSAYVSYSRGYKGGGFNLDRDFDGDNSFAAEFADSWEIGAKTAWLGGDLILNGAVYMATFEDYQLNRFNGVSFVVNTIPEVDSRGVEVDMIWRMPVEGLSMQGGVAYTETEYADDASWVVSGLTLLPGSRLTNAPLWTVTDALSYETPVFNDSLTGLIYIDFRYVSDQSTASDLHPSKEQPGYVLVNGRLGLSTPDERYAIELWGRNLLDEEYAQIMFDAPIQFLAPVLPVTGLRGAFLGDPRTYGLTLRARY